MELKINDRVRVLRGKHKDECGTVIALPTFDPADHPDRAFGYTVHLDNGVTGCGSLDLFEPLKEATAQPKRSQSFK